MKKLLLISITILVLTIIYFGYKFFSAAAGMMEAEDIKLPAIEKVTSIDDIVQPYIQHNTTKGLSIGVYDKGRINYYNYGICSDIKPVLPTNQSIYEIASITKTFTAATLVQMVQEGKVQYHDPISKYLPKGVVNWSDSLAITLEELATHQSGFPKIPDNHLKRAIFNMDNPYKNYSEKDLYNFLRSYTPKPKAKRKVAYSNLGMGLLGNILAMVENTSYEGLIQRKITQPLGMNHTFGEYKPQRQVTGHNGYGEPTAAWEDLTLEGAGAIRSSTSDMMKYLITNINEDPPFGETHTPRADYGEKTKMGLGWLTIFPKNTNLELLFHNGGSGGFKSTMLFSKEKQMGVVVLSNSIQSVDGIGIRIMELVDRQQAISKLE